MSFKNLPNLLLVFFIAVGGLLLIAPLPTAQAQICCGGGTYEARQDTCDPNRFGIFSCNSQPAYPPDNSCNYVSGTTSCQRKDSVYYYDGECLTDGPNGCTWRTYGIHPVTSNGCFESWTGSCVVPTPTPGPPPPGSCSDYWYCSGTIPVGSFPDLAACYASGGVGASCQCGAPNCGGKRYTSKAYVVFEDNNENGIWDYNSGEDRLSGNNGCSGSNITYVPGLYISVDGTSEIPGNNCDVGDSEHTANECTFTCNNGPNGTCATWSIAGKKDVQNTCFTVKTCQQCGGDWNGWSCRSGPDGITIGGKLCGGHDGYNPNGDYCNGSSAGYLKDGPYNIITKAQGTRPATVMPPPGWRASKNSNITNRQVSYPSGSGFTCTGVEFFGLVRDYSKTCQVLPGGATDISPGDPLYITLTGQSNNTTPENVRLWVGKTDYSQITSSGVPYTPTGTTEVVSSGRYYYEYTAASCNTSNGNSCGTSITISDLPQGLYYLHCDLPTTPQQCSGNPNCSYEGLGGSVDCASSGWQSCSNNDNLSVAIIAPSPTPTPTLSPTPTPTPVPIISGNFYDDNGANPIAPGEVCVQSNPKTSIAPDNPAVDAYGISGTILPGGSSYTINTLTSGFFNVTLDISNQNPAGTVYSCSCPSSANPFLCTYTDMTSPSVTDVDFYLTPYNLSNTSWWQASGASVYGQGGITSVIPYVDCDPDTDCYSGLIAGNPFDTSTYQDTAGFPMTNQGSVDTEGTGSSTAYIHPASARTISDQAFATGFSLPVENYSYFNTKLTASPTNITDISTTNYASLLINPGVTNIFRYTGGSMTINETDSWQVPSGTSVIVLIDDDLTLEDSAASENQITDVEEGGFLAFIMSGDMTIESSVGHDIVTGQTLNPTSLTPNVEGVFIADGTITVLSQAPATADKKFVGAGTFVGWSGINLPRNFEFTADPLSASINNTNATETFIYRPDLLENYPYELKSAQVKWQEIAPVF